MTELGGVFQKILWRTGKNAEKMNCHHAPKSSAKLFWRILSQVCILLTLILFDIGSSGGLFVREVLLHRFSIPELSNSKDITINELLAEKLSGEKWGDILDVLDKARCFGYVLSGLISGPIGRKRSIILFGLLNACAWLLMANISGSLSLYTAIILLGTSMGAIRVPYYAFFGEYCEPWLRSILAVTASTIFWGSFFIANEVVKMCADFGGWLPNIYSVICLVGAVVMLFCPESPIWLIAKNRHSEAEKSLRWYRGWTTASHIEHELLDLHRHCKAALSCPNCRQTSVECQHTSMFHKLRGIFEFSTYVPFLLYTVAGILKTFTNTVTKRFPSTIYIQLNGNDDGYYDYTSLFTVFTNIICIILIRFAGKRQVYLCSLLGAIAVTLSLGIAFIFGLFENSMTQSNQLNGVFVDIPGDKVPSAYGFDYLLPFQLLLSFVMSGICVIPTILVCEIFAFKNRSWLLASAFALNSVAAFRLETLEWYIFYWIPYEDVALEHSDVAFFICAIFTLGYLFVYWLFPETENRTLEEIELYFSDRKRAITDVVIKQQEPSEHSSSNRRAPNVYPNLNGLA